MTILADSQIRDLCKLPEHLVNFEAFLSGEDAQTPWPDGDTRVSRAKDFIPTLNPFSPINILAATSSAPTWLKTLADKFVNLLEPFDRPSMIEPFIDSQVRSEPRRIDGDEEYETTEVKVISYGLSSYGYDARLSDEIKTFTNINGGV